MRLDIEHDFNKKLLGLGIYLTAIRLMVYLAWLPWNAVAVGPTPFHIWATGPGVWQQGYDVEMVMESAKTPTGSRPFKTRDLVPALWETMDQTSECIFYYETTTTVKLQGREIGTLKIQELTRGATANGTSANVDILSNQVLSHDAALNVTQAISPITTKNPSYPSGQLPFPKDPRFALVYTYKGTQIKSKHVFMAILGLLGEIAQSDHAEPIEKVKQVSPSKKCAVTLDHNDEYYSLIYLDAVIALSQLVFAIMLPLEKFETMDFWVLFEGHRIARGSIFALGPADEVAAEEE